MYAKKTQKTPKTKKQKNFQHQGHTENFGLYCGYGGVQTGAKEKGVKWSNGVDSG